MRHGQPAIPEFDGKVGTKGFLKCLEIYKNCGILDTDKPANTLIDKFRGFDAIVCSDLKRSIESASLLSSQNSLIVDPMFREIDDTFIQIPLVRLRPKTWSRIFILLWFFGMFEFRKAFREGKIRARKCAKRLVDLAETHGKVLFVGHGFINRYIAKELKLLGWDGPKMPSKRYWDYGVYQKSST